MLRHIDDKPPFVVEFEQFLQSNKYFIRRVLQSEMDSTYNVRAEVTEESKSFEVDFEFSEEFDYCHLTTSCLDSISPEKYPSCLELLNFINVHDSREKFYIFPD